MDEQLARLVADELVKVVWVNGGTWGVGSGTWVVSFGVGRYRLTYDRKEAADDVAEALRLLAITAISRYNGASPTPEITEVSESLDSRQGVGKREPPPMPLGGLMPDLFAGELEAMSKILGRVSGLLGKEARRLIQAHMAAADLVANTEKVISDMPHGSIRDSLISKCVAARKALEVLSKE